MPVSQHLTFAEILARTAARRAAGTNQTYPQHTGKAKITQPIAPAAPKPSPDKPCVHRGKDVLRTEKCGPCGGKAQLKVFACSEFGECTIAKPLAGVGGCCKGCTKYEAA